jgi:hypothetical protein
MDYKPFPTRFQLCARFSPRGRRVTPIGNCSLEGSFSLAPARQGALVSRKESRSARVVGPRKPINNFRSLASALWLAQTAQYSRDRRCTWRQFARKLLFKWVGFLLRFRCGTKVEFRSSRYAWPRELCLLWPVPHVYSTLAHCAVQECRSACITWNNRKLKAKENLINAVVGCGWLPGRVVG